MVRPGIIKTCIIIEVISMSFGFGLGDFLATLKLADELKRRFAQAPSQFKVISGEYVHCRQSRAIRITDY